MNNATHGADCDCGCNEDNEMTVSMTLDDGTELTCAVLAIFPVDTRQYIALLPLQDDGSEAEDSDIFLYRFKELEDGELDLTTIEDESEYELVAEAFDELLDDAEFDEMIEDDDE